MWGELEGLYTYESLIGESITVPCMTAKYVSFFEDTTLSGDDAPEVSGAAAKTEDELLSQLKPHPDMPSRTTYMSTWIAMELRNDRWIL